MKVFEETTGKLCSSARLRRGIVAIYETNNELILEFGFFKRSNKNACLYDDRTGDVLDLISSDISDKIIFSTKIGYYIIKPQSANKLIEHICTKGNGSFPYNISREYAAAKNLDIFEGVQEVLNYENFDIAKYLYYSFGLEFETSAGYVPADICFRDGLIPLRDGSISGVEYSSVVLSGNSGLQLLKQECDTLKKYTVFDKNCALHIHLGGYPISPERIMYLYKLLYFIQDEIEVLLPRLSFYTSEYKDNGKDYCAKIPFFNTFSELYYYMSCNNTNFLGDLYQAHPNDINKEHKWNITTRYHNFNFVNMLFYTSPKTLELRFFRPTFNFEKILLWLAIFNGLLMYAQSESNDMSLQQVESDDLTETLKYTSLSHILSIVYPDNIYDYIVDGISKLRAVLKNQDAVNDPIGARIDIENSIFN